MSALAFHTNDTPFAPSFTPCFENYTAEISGLLCPASSSSSSSSSPPSPLKFEQCRQILKSMRVEARNCPDRVAAVKRYKEMSCLVDSAELRSGGNDGNYDGGGEGKDGGGGGRGRVEDVNGRMARQNDVLENLKATVAEMEDVGTAITGELAQNRELLERTKGRVGLVNENITLAQKITQRMTDRIGKFWK